MSFMLCLSLFPYTTVGQQQVKADINKWSGQSYHTVMKRVKISGEQEREPQKRYSDAQTDVRNTTEILD